MKTPQHMTLANLEVLVMPNGEVLSRQDDRMGQRTWQDVNGETMKGIERIQHVFIDRGLDTLDAFTRAQIERVAHRLHETEEEIEWRLDGMTRTSALSETAITRRV
jgi:hypothetical protein